MASHAAGATRGPVRCLDFRAAAVFFSFSDFFTFISCFQSKTIEGQRRVYDSEVVFPRCGQKKHTSHRSDCAGFTSCVASRDTRRQHVECCPQLALANGASDNRL